MKVKKVYIGDIHRRLIAGFIDLLILNFLMWILYKLFSFLAKAGQYEYLTEVSDNVYFAVGFVLVFLSVIILYFSAQHASFTQGTVGKRMMGLEVVDREGQPISGSKAFKRACVKIISYIFFFLSGPLIIFSSHALSLEDRAVGTYVVLKKSDIEE